MRPLSAVLIALLVATAAPAARAADPAPVTASDQSPIKIQPTEGTELAPKDEKAVRKVLADYLAAMQKKDYKKAGEMIDRASLLAAVDPMVKSISSDSTTTGPAMQKIFGASTRQQLESHSTGDLFASLMGYITGLDSGAADVLSKATIEVLAARQMKDVVHVAYQVSLPPEKEGDLPYQHITVQKMSKSDGKWRILFSLE